VSQRFRLDYILGNPELKESEEEEVEAEEAEQEETGESEESFIDLAQTALVLDKARKQARDLAKELGEDLRKELEATSDDERVLEEIFEENFDSLLREDERFGEIVDDLLDEIERRFDLLREGRPGKTKQGWLRSWQWETPNRADIIRAVRRFSSNYVRYWGTLLTPIVSGIRVAGPFMPSWRTTMPLLVLQDGEGLGHTPDSAASLPPEVTRRFDDGDAILLVDNGAQPMSNPGRCFRTLLASSGSR
jgi:hypothetical protein